MCGRFTISEPKELIEKRFGAKFQYDLFNPRYNAAPSQLLPIITNLAPEVIVPAQWGFVPSWLKAPRKKDGFINARGETLGEKPLFRNAFKSKRCLVLADGFYEWDKSSKISVPYFIYLKDKKLFSFAGIWDEDADGIMNFAIITTGPNELVEKIHNRMPVILEEDKEKLWLGQSKPLDLMPLLKPYPEELMSAHQVSRAVNSPSLDAPELTRKYGLV